MTTSRRVLTITLMLGLFGAPLTAKAQPAGRVYRIGWLDAGAPESLELKTFRKGLQDLGYVEGRNIVVESRWAGGTFDRLPELAGELVRLKLDVIVTRGGDATLAAKDATSTIPIVMATGWDPVARGLVASLARPGGNVTGLTFLVGGGLWGKRLALLRSSSS